MLVADTFKVSVKLNQMSVERESYVVCTSEKGKLMLHSMMKYPSNWKKASLVIRRMAEGRCEWCHQPCTSLSTHHIGAPHPDGKNWVPGNSRNKHDLRRENLVAICFSCHDQVDHIRKVRQQFKERKRRRKARLEAHRALNIGTGLVLINNVAF